MVLTFDREEVEGIVAEVKVAGEHCALYDDPETTGPGLWLVADDGVYLMGNHRRAEGELPVVAFAKEADPNKLPFDEWWPVRSDVFGGDDGATYLPCDGFIDHALTRLALIEHRSLKLGLSGDSITVLL